MNLKIKKRPQLTDEQVAAAGSAASRAFIVAVPGSGKTTVASTRFGVQRYSTGFDPRRVLGLSFARSATAELAIRTRRRWGQDVLSWPHEVMTLDSLNRELISHLLRREALRWPEGHQRPTVLDTWRGQQGARYLLPEHKFRRAVTIKDDEIVSRSIRIASAVYGIGRKGDFDAHLSNALCTHEEIRMILRESLARDDLRGELKTYLSETTRSVIVDEVFDANNLDLDVILLVIECGIPTTLIGDPWQALYEFRGAQPQLVPLLVDNKGFRTLPISRSFRYETEEMRQMTEGLREGAPTALQPGEIGQVDVVLASHWEMLWATNDRVLPLSFGRIDNQTDAAIVLLLDQMVTAHFGTRAIYCAEAISLLGLEPDVVLRDGRMILLPILQQLKDGNASTLKDAMTTLRNGMKLLGSSRQLRRLRRNSEDEQLGRLQALALRVGRNELVQGLTVHQAKGREWDRVGVRLSETQRNRLAEGLNQTRDTDRLLYVALTRAREATTEV